jgi:hypothetical protein
LMVAVHSMVATFMAAGIIPAYETFAEDYGTSIHTATYLTSVQVGLLTRICVLSSDNVILDPCSWNRSFLLEAINHKIWPLPHLSAVSSG